MTRGSQFSQNPVVKVQSLFPIQVRESFINPPLTLSEWGCPFWVARSRQGHRMCLNRPDPTFLRFRNLFQGPSLRVSLFSKLMNTLMNSTTKSFIQHILNPRRPSAKGVLNLGQEASEVQRYFLEARGSSDQGLKWLFNPRWPSPPSGTSFLVQSGIKWLRTWAQFHKAVKQKLLLDKLLCLKQKSSGATVTTMLT